jgi:AraC-like DNA-binding protein
MVGQFSSVYFLKLLRIASQPSRCIHGDGIYPTCKIEAAKRIFESSQKNINEVMFDVGYTDTKAFRTVFKKVTGLTPIEYQNKYNKQEPVGLV